MLSLLSQALVEASQHESCGKNPGPVAIERMHLKCQGWNWRPDSAEDQWKTKKPKKKQKIPNSLKSRFLRLFLYTQHPKQTVFE